MCHGMTRAFDTGHPMQNAWCQMLPHTTVFGVCFSIETFCIGYPLILGVTPCDLDVIGTKYMGNLSWKAVSTIIRKKFQTKNL